ncbi:MAG: hypothetical protein HYZ72_10850 [Deltaproteobacteria bacterium]|nr:hypothetical protein [Deltaproteobacteria bacterium]
MWAPEHFIEHIAPRPLLIVTNGAYDLHHPLDQIQIAFRKAGEPKRLEILPYDVVGLYVEPGLGEAMGHAVEWFDRYLRKAR